MPDLDAKLLPFVYFGDQLAVANAAVALARRTASSSQRDDVRELAARHARELEDDRAALRRTAAALGIRRDRLKETAAAAAERAGRLKLNGRLRTRSPLTDITELQALVACDDFLTGTWRGIAEAYAADARLAEAGIEPTERAQGAAVRAEAARALVGPATAAALG